MLRRFVCVYFVEMVYLGPNMNVWYLTFRRARTYLQNLSEENNGARHLSRYFDPPSDLLFYVCDPEIRKKTDHFCHSKQSHYLWQLNRLDIIFENNPNNKSSPFYWLTYLNRTSLASVKCYRFTVSRLQNINIKRQDKLDRNPCPLWKLTLI